MMGGRLRELRTRLEREMGRLEQVRAALAQKRIVLQEARAHDANISRARDVVQAVAISTQQQLKGYIEELVSLALASVFDQPYKFVVDFVVRRGHTEVDLFFERNGDKLSPLESSGGGAVDVAAFALRVVVWSLTKGARTTLLLDEPFRFLSLGLHANAAALLKSLSDRMGLQIIMVTHSDELASGADKVFPLGM